MQTTGAATLVARVRKTPAGPQLFVNGRPTAPTMLFVNLHDVADDEHTPLQLGEVEAAGRHGVNLVSLTVGTPWPREGETPDFHGLAGHWVELALKANPKALLLPRIHVSWPPEWWYSEHPDERMRFDDGQAGVPSVHSEAWRRDAVRNLTALVGYLEAHYGDHIVGYHPSGQHSGEWFYDRNEDRHICNFEEPARAAFRRFVNEMYHTDAALQRAWHDPSVTLVGAEPPSLESRRNATRGAFRDPVAERRVIDFDQFQNEAMADAAILMCHAVKQAAPDKLAVTFYGYPFELASVPQGLQESGHLAMGRLLQSPDVDAVCSPVSYHDRGSGGGGYFMAPVDSVQQHDKLWLVEDDTRTHLSPPDAGYGRLEDFGQTRGVLARNFAHLASRGAAVWWMDLPGQGWFAGDEMWEYLGRLHGTYSSALPDQQAYRPEIAVVVDEHSPLYGAPTGEVNGPLMTFFRTALYRIGAPVGLYLLDDLLAGKVPRAKLCIFLNAFCLEDAQLHALREHTGQKGGVRLWMYAPGIVHGNALDSAHIGEVTGIAVKEIAPRPGRVRLTGSSDVLPEANVALKPTFAVADPAAEALARYALGEDVAVAARHAGGVTDVYSGVLQLPTRVLRDLARRAGVHLYAETDDVVIAGSGWVGLHASAAGHKVVHMPIVCSLRDVTTGETLGPARSFAFEMAQGDTKLLRLARPGGSGERGQAE
jgi:hypothetical protein